MNSVNLFYRSFLTPYPSVRSWVINLQEIFSKNQFVVKFVFYNEKLHWKIHLPSKFPQMGRIFASCMYICKMQICGTFLRKGRRQMNFQVIYRNDLSSPQTCIDFEFFGHFRNLVNQIKWSVWKHLKLQTFGISLLKMKHPRPTNGPNL